MTDTETTREKDSRVPESVLDAYLECALWASTDENGEDLDDKYGPEDFAPETLAEMVSDLEDFMGSNKALIARATEGHGMSPEDIARDFWLTREGHGTGFWDRGLGNLGDDLTNAAQIFGPFYLYAYEGKLYS